MLEAPRRYTTQELAAMPATARLKDRDGYEWQVCYGYFYGGEFRRTWSHGGTPLMLTCSQLARRKLRRIA